MPDGQIERRSSVARDFPRRIEWMIECRATGGARKARALAWPSLSSTARYEMDFPNRSLKTQLSSSAMRPEWRKIRLPREENALQSRRRPQRPHGHWKFLEQPTRGLFGVWVGSCLGRCRGPLQRWPGQLVWGGCSWVDPMIGITRSGTLPVQAFFQSLSRARGVLSPLRTRICASAVN